MTKLHEIIAVHGAIKADQHSKISSGYKHVQKPELFNGMNKNYTPIDDNGEIFPSESKIVQFMFDDVLTDLRNIKSRFFDVQATLDIANCSAKADVKIGGRVILSDVPVSYLLFLEKQLKDIETFISTMPVLDIDTSWQKDMNTGLFTSKEITTTRTKKVERPLIIVEATDKHPAQAKTVIEDVTIGHWSTVKLSGAMPMPVRKAMLERLTQLQYAVKIAREQANAVDVTEVTGYGSSMFDYIING
jgi:hypothetical protein